MGKSIPRPAADVDAAGPSASPVRRALRVARKVPEVTLLFWVIKILTTAMGESTSDFLVYDINRYLAVALGGLGLAIALALQFWVRRYIPWVYWLAVLMVAIFGTMAADVLHIVLGVSYLASTVCFSLALAIIFAIWYAKEKTLSIHSIDTPRREVFYWAAVMATFALGTAAGDLTADTFKLGYLASGVLFAALFALPAAGYTLVRLNAIFAFWFAYVMTRPLGASFADWFGKPILGGLGLGDGVVSLVLVVVIAGCVGYLTLTHADTQHAARAPRG